MSSFHLGSNAGCLRGREMRQGVKGMSHPELANCHRGPRGERGGKTRLTALTLLHISSYLYDQWGGGGGGRAGWNPGAELTATPVLSPLTVAILFLFFLPLSLPHLSPSPGSLGLRLFISLAHVLCLSLNALWSSFPPGISFSLCLSPSFPHMGSSFLPDSPLPPCHRDSLLIPGSLKLMN